MRTGDGLVSPRAKCVGEDGGQDFLDPPLVWPMRNRKDVEAEREALSTFHWMGDVDASRSESARSAVGVRCSARGPVRGHLGQYRRHHRLQPQTYLPGALRWDLGAPPLLVSASAISSLTSQTTSLRV